MSHINNLEAYFGTATRNWDKNDCRSNDNFFKHISSVGDESDIQHELADSKIAQEYDTNSIENILRDKNVENWLLLSLLIVVCLMPSLTF